MLHSGHQDEAPQKVNAIKKYLLKLFPDHKIQHSYEAGRRLHSFRIEGVALGPISLSEEYFFDLPNHEEAILTRLNEARVPQRIKESDENTRIVVMWDEAHPGQPLSILEPLNSRKPSTASGR